MTLVDRNCQKNYSSNVHFTSEIIQMERQGSLHDEDSKLPHQSHFEEDVSSEGALTDCFSLTDFEDGEVSLQRQIVAQTKEIQELKEELQAERRKTSKMHQKLQFVRENQEVFVRLKEAYINMKYNEAAGRKMIEIRQRAVQTWEGALCGACVETEALRRELECLSLKYSQLYVLSPSEMERLLNMVKYLKDLLKRREESWEEGFERQCRYQSHIAMLEAENQKLKKSLKIHSGNPDLLEDVLDDDHLNSKLVTQTRLKEIQKVVEELSKNQEKLKKIIVKYEKHFRDVNDSQPGRWISPLTDKETKLVNQIVVKYSDGLSKRGELTNVNKPTQARRPSSPFGAKIAESAAILNLDRLFE